MNGERGGGGRGGGDVSIHMDEFGSLGYQYLVTKFLFKRELREILFRRCLSHFLLMKGGRRGRGRGEREGRRRDTC